MATVTIQFETTPGDTIPVDLDVYVEDNGKCYLEEVLETGDIAGILYGRHKEELESLANAKLKEARATRRISPQGQMLMDLGQLMTKQIYGVG